MQISAIYGSPEKGEMTLNEGIKKGFKEEGAVGWCVNNGYDPAREGGRRTVGEEGTRKERAWRQKSTRLPKDQPAPRLLGQE